MTKKEIKIRITSVQRSGSDGEDENTVEIVTDATLSDEGGRLSVSYSEFLSDRAAPTATTLVFDKESPDTVFLSREGEITMSCVIAEKTRYRFAYNLGFTSIELVCVGHEVRNNISSFGGEMFLRYDIEAHGVTVQSCEMTITII